MEGAISAADALAPEDGTQILAVLDRDPLAARATGESRLTSCHSLIPASTWTNFLEPCLSACLPRHSSVSAVPTACWPGGLLWTIVSPTICVRRERSCEMSMVQSSPTAWSSNAQPLPMACERLLDLLGADSGTLLLLETAGPARPA